MGKYLITGVQGSGKTTIIKRLQGGGYTAFNTDDLPNVTKLQNKHTGECIEWPSEAVDWNTYAWNWQSNELKKLLATDSTVFIGAIVSNQAEFYDLFDKVFVLVVDSDTLRSRLLHHEHASHHLPGAIDRIISRHTTKQLRFIEDGAVPINADGNVADIVQEILSLISSKS